MSELYPRKFKLWDDVKKNFKETSFKLTEQQFEAIKEVRGKLNKKRLRGLTEFNNVPLFLDLYGSRGELTIDDTLQFIIRVRLRSDHKLSRILIKKKKISPYILSSKFIRETIDGWVPVIKDYLKKKEEDPNYLESEDPEDIEYKTSWELVQKIEDLNFKDKQKILKSVDLRTLNQEIDWIKAKIRCVSLNLINLKKELKFATKLREERFYKTNKKS